MNYTFILVDDSIVVEVGVNTGVDREPAIGVKVIPVDTLAIESLLDEDIAILMLPVVLV